MSEVGKMEYVEGDTASSTVSYILCCQCGTQIEPNATNMCVACLRTQVDITVGISKQNTLYFCRNCERYLVPPGAWVKAALESRELLAVCLKKIKGLKDVRLVDAGFVWTEPHSKRIKTKLTVQKEVTQGAVVQQVFVIEFVVHNQMCDDCHRVEAKDYWRACVQVRQKTSHKKTLYYLEQMMLKHRAHANTTSIKPVAGGIDFFYSQNQDAKKLVEFLQAVVPCKYQTAKELVSHDEHTNVYNYKTSFSVEIVPVCKDNIVCLSAKLAQQLGNIGQICVVYRVTQTVHLIDPVTTQIAEVSGQVYWRAPFSAICEPRQLIRFLVMEVDLVRPEDRRHVSGAGQSSTKHALADVYVCRMVGDGIDDQQYHCKTHLGHLLTPGDTVLGLHLATANLNDANLETLKTERLPDVVLVKKVYADSMVRARKRRFKLRHIQEDVSQTSSMERDYNDFLEDLEEDAVYRQNVNMYKDARIPVDENDTDNEELPQVSLQEMLDDLHLDDDDMGEEI